ncbi:glycosyltransferase [Anaerolineales bacterium HSG25]|nr:glycosyltransferase [Anaerolineales bacterium HSG25]
MFLRNVITIVAKNSLFNGIGKLSIKIISFAFTIFIVRWLGDKGYGQYVLIWSYVAIFSMLSDAGLGMYAIREIAKRTVGHEYLMANIIIIRLFLAIITIGLTYGTAFYLGYSDQFLLNLFLASLILLIYAIQDPFDTVLQANERFDISAISVICGQLLFVGVGGILLFLGWHITGLIIAALLNITLTAWLAWFLMNGCRRHLRWQLKPTHWFTFLKAAFPFGMIKLWLSWALKIDLIILAWYWPDETVGWYGAAYALVSGALVVGGSINSAFYPTLSRQYSRDHTMMPQIYGFGLKYLLIIGLPISGLLFVGHTEIVDLFFGTEFAPAAIPLAILIWVVPLTFVTEFLRYILLIKNQERIAVYALSGTVLTSILLNLWFIPTYGLIAASLIVVIAETTLLGLYSWHLKTDLQTIDLANVAIKPIVAIVLTMVALYNLPSWNIILQFFIGSSIYLALIRLFGVISSYEYELLVSELFKHVKGKEIVSSRKRTTSPLVSIFIPAYNAGHFLGQTINSVLNQTYSNYELIIVNDGSTDDSNAILAHYESHPQVQIYHNPTNVGMAANWNIALNYCRGELIAKLDADDYYEPTYLDEVVAMFQKESEIGLVFTGVNLLYPDGRFEPEMQYLSSWVRNREAFLPELLRLCVIRSPTVCVRRNCYDELGNFDEQMRLHTDWEMWVRIAANYKVGYISHLLANYRMNYGDNCTAQAPLDGRSMADLRHWLTRLKQETLPYLLTQPEEAEFRWGIYEMEMHFAGMAAYYHQTSNMPEQYANFAEEVLHDLPTTNDLVRMRSVYLSLHQGICAFREKQLSEARQYFLSAIRQGPMYCRAPWIWSKLLLTFLGRTKWGFLYK